MRNTVKMGVILMVICLSAAALLSLVYGVSVPIIKENEKIANESKRRQVLPNATSFEEIDADGQTYYIGYDDKKNNVGAVMVARPRGYSSTINITIGVAPNGSINAIELSKLDQQETPGLGAKVATPKFKEQFKGKTVEQLKLKKDNGEIDAITAATITSRAATNGIREKLEWYLGKK